jgi:hypothetical protein
MSYYESAESTDISFARAAIECVKHGASVVEMLADLGERDSYAAQELLSWLGY